MGIWGYIGAGRRVAALVLLALAAVTAFGAERAGASYDRPAILGTWTTVGSPVGNPPIVVTPRGNRATGRAKVKDGCVKAGRPVWKIDFANGGFASGTIEYFKNPGCGSAGFGQATWLIPSGSDAGQLCSFPPGGGSQYCQQIVRDGAPPPLPPLYAIDSRVSRCLASHSWWQFKVAYCTQLYHAPGPGTWQTYVGYCNNPGFIPCPKDLSKCAVFQFVCTDFARREPFDRRKTKVVKLAGGSFDFTDPGEAESSIDLAPAKKPTKKLKKLADKKRKVRAYVVSVFRPDGGEPRVSSKGFSIHLR